MVKGVSKSVIEINNTQDSYIERAILFINPDKASHSKLQLKAQAAAFLQNADRELQEVPVKKYRPTVNRIVFLLLSFISGAALMYGLTVFWI